METTNRSCLLTTLDINFSLLFLIKKIFIRKPTATKVQLKPQQPKATNITLKKKALLNIDWIMHWAWQILLFSAQSLVLVLKISSITIFQLHYRCLPSCTLKFLSPYRNIGSSQPRLLTTMENDFPLNWIFNQENSLHQSITIWLWLLKARRLA